MGRRAAFASPRHPHRPARDRVLRRPERGAATGPTGLARDLTVPSARTPAASAALHRNAAAAARVGTRMEEAPRRSAPPRDDDVISQERFDRYHRFARERGTSRVLYYVARVLLVPAFLIWFPPPALGSRARPVQGRAHRRLQPPQLPRPVRDRRAAALAAADAVRRQGRAVREALAGLAALSPRRLPDPPRPVGRDRHGHGADDRRARRHRDHLPRGHPDPHAARSGARSAASAASRSRPAPRCCRSRSRAPRRSAAAGASARARSACAPASRSPSRARSIPRRPSPRASPTASGRTSNCSGSGSAACRPCARRR